MLQGCFPEPDKDPVIQIASMVTNQGETTPVVRNVMTLDTCAAIIGSEVMSFKTEQELLKVKHSFGTSHPPLLSAWVEGQLTTSFSPESH